MHQHEFYTPVMRELAARILERIEAIKEEGVGAADEPPHEHPFRVGKVVALREAVDIIHDYDKQIAGVEK